MAYGFEVQAVYQDGFSLREPPAGPDESPFDATRNTFHAIMSGQAEAAHGPMVTWSLMSSGGGEWFRVDWTKLAGHANPRPIYYRAMTRTVHGDGADTGPVCQAHYFGYQYTDATGANVEHIESVSPPAPPAARPAALTANEGTTV